MASFPALGCTAPRQRESHPEPLPQAAEKRRRQTPGPRRRHTLHSSAQNLRWGRRRLRQPRAPAARMWLWPGNCVPPVGGAARAWRIPEVQPAAASR